MVISGIFIGLKFLISLIDASIALDVDIVGKDLQATKASDVVKTNAVSLSGRDASVGAPASIEVMSMHCLRSDNGSTYPWYG